MTLTKEQIEMLQAGLPASAVSKRKGGGSMMLSYIEGHTAIDTANRIFGFDGWSYRISELECLGAEKTAKDSHQTAYRATVLVTVGDTVRQDAGFGIASDKYSLLAAHELALKEAVTDALKRALRSFGNQFGNSLYEKGNPLHKGGRDSKGASDPKEEGESGKLLQTLMTRLGTIELLNELNDEMRQSGFQADAKSLLPEHYSKLKKYANERIQELK